MIDEMGVGLPNVKRSDIAYRHMRDPALLRYYYKIKTVLNLKELGVEGSSPTDLFIGRYGYPNVFIGPLVPPEFGDTSLLGMPELWRDKSIEEIVGFRSRLIRGMHLTRVDAVEKGKIEEGVRDLALAENPTDIEVELNSKPFVRMEYLDEVQPYGPSAKMKGFGIQNIRADKRIESRYTDTDAKAATSLTELYERDVPVSKMQRALAAGLLGLGGNRKFVPTRWSITAVDDTLSKYNLNDVKALESVDAIQCYYNVALDNRWLIFFIPGKWQYESIEAWYPKTVWNMDGTDISIYSSYEGYYGRKTYAEIGGCYYAARLAVTERMKKIGRQGVVLILREVHDGYIMPVGVWNVREHVRETLATEPTILHNTREMFEMMKKRLAIPQKAWVKNSRILRDSLMQSRISDYLKI
jgi:hypothetical protein